MPKCVVIRAGGLGDFILTLPFVKALATQSAQTTLITKPSFGELIRADNIADRILNIDSAAFASCFHTPDDSMRRLLEDAAVYSFLPDRDGVFAGVAGDCGVRSLTVMDGTPATPPHVTERMFADSDLTVPGALDNKSILAPQAPLAGKRLWLHPGSGSPAKNPELEFLVEQADDWLKNNDNGIILSFGEADIELLPMARRLFAGMPVEFVVEPTLPELRLTLVEKGAVYLGGDTGVTHLAAALGLETTVVFRCTDPRIWRPLGRRVHVLNEQELGAGHDGLI